MPSHLLWYDREKMERRLVMLVRKVAQTIHNDSLHKFFWATGQNLRKSKPHEMNLIKIYVYGVLTTRYVEVTGLLVQWKELKLHGAGTR